MPGKTATRKKAPPKVRGRRWSAGVTARSDALDLERSVFRWKDPRRIAASLKKSAERSKRRKGTPFQSAMSMLNFYINRAGRNLGAGQRRVLERAKAELRRQFGAAKSYNSARRLEKNHTAVDRDGLARHEIAQR
jgi:hypothetical protein